jgi:hypothetical protein
MIDIRRRQEQKYRQMDGVRTANDRALQIANFEINTANKIDRRTRMGTLHALRKHREASLLERRKKLAELYNMEMDSWREEALSRVETQEDRKARIMERAHALKDSRERAQQDYVKKAYDRQWRLACDDARLLDSEALEKFMSDERLRQIEEKRRNKIALSDSENDFLDEWKRQLDLIEERDRQKLQAQKDADLATQAGLREQISYNQQMKQDHWQRTREEDESELGKLREDIAADERLLRQRANDAKMRGKAIRDDNALHKYVLAEEKEKERKENAILLDYALRMEKRAMDQEKAKLDGQKEAALKYRAYLQEQMIKEAEDNSFMEEVCKKEEERVWKARDDLLAAREEARRRLMVEVDKGRQEQIARKLAEEERDREEGKVFADKFIRDAKDGIEMERQEALHRKQLSIENDERLKEQISIRRRKDEAEKQENFLADKHMQYIERLHRQKLAEQGPTLRLHWPLQHSQWYT